VTTDRLSMLLRLDAVANVAIGLAALALLAAPDVLGLPPAALVAIGLLTLVNAVDLARSGRQPVPSPAAVRRSAGVDLTFGLALVAAAATGLPGQSDVARWVLAGVGDVALVVGVLKLWGVHHLGTDRVGSPAR
jgi:hypothetical protein